MKSAKLIRTLIWSGVLAVAGIFSVGAQAQDLPKTISPLQVEPDRNGVNIATGKMTPDALALSIPAAPRLKFDRVQNAAPYISGEQHKDWDTSSELSAEWTVHTADGMSEAFRCVWDPTDGKQCASATASGSSLTYGGNYYRKSGSGERYVLNLVHVFTNPPRTDPNPRHLRIFYASKIEYPDGEVISYSYDTSTLNGDPYGRAFYRPNKISTNLGYYITITYPHNDLAQVGWGSPNAVALYSVNDPATPLARLTSNGSGSLTDLSGRVFQGYSLGTLGVDVETAGFTRTLPTESSPNLSVTPAAGLPTNAEMVGSVTQDGVAWGYTYTNPQYYAGISGYLFDQVEVNGPDGYHRTYTITKTSPLSPIGNRNLVTRVTNELGQQTNYEYDVNLRITKIKKPEGNAVSLGWDLAGNVVTKTLSAKSGTGLSAIVEQNYVNLAAYLSPTGGYVNCTDTALCWRPIWHRDALNRQTDFVYNSRGQLVEELQPADANGVRKKTIIEYTEKDTGAGLISRKTKVRICGETTTCGTTAEIVTEFEYWDNTNMPTVERQRDVSTGEVRETRYAYDPSGRVLSVDGPRAGWDDARYFRYDQVGRKTWEIGPLGPNGLRAAKRFGYRDADDKIVSVDSGSVTSETSTTLSPLERSDVTYDSRRNAVREVVSAKGQTLKVTDRSFLSRGAPECTAVRMNLAALPPAGPSAACSLGTQGSQGPDRITRNIYDLAGRLERVQQALGTTLQRNQVTFSYTPNGQKEFITDAGGNKTRLLYDGHDRQTFWYFPDKTSIGSVSSTDYEQYGYDAVGNRTTVRRRDGRTLVYAYDGRNQVISKVVPDGCAPIAAGACPSASATRDVFYSYDISGRPLLTKYDGLTGADGVTNTYDSFGDLRSSTISFAGFSKVLTSQYGPDGNRIRLTHPDAQSFTYAYDALNRLSGVYEGPDTTVSLANFLYNERGLIAGRLERSGSGVTYEYDPIGRLSKQSDSFVGGAGNVTAGPISYNAASQVVSVVTDNGQYTWPDSYIVTRNYTTNGLNQYTQAGAAIFTYDANGNLISDGVTTFGYDAENRLVSTSAGVSLTYDPTGRLWQVAQGGVSSRFLYDGDALVAEFDGAGAMKARYVHGSNQAADDPLVWYENGTTRWLHANRQGSIVGATNGSGGAPAINTYDDWGIPGTANVGRFQFTGQLWLKELGLYHYKARIYSPTLGRFLQTDPVGYEDQYNLYAYVANDPVNKLDPDGKEILETTHDVFGGVSHTKIVLVPADQKRWEKDPRFERRLPDGRHYATLGAGPEGGKLVSGVNRPRDADMSINNSRPVALKLPKGIDENAMIERLFKLDKNYKDNLDYDLFPNGFFGQGADGYNSNSYARGLMNAAGLTGQRNFAGSTVPGYNKPVPRSEFKGPGATPGSPAKCVTTGSRLPQSC